MQCPSARNIFRRPFSGVRHCEVGKKDSKGVRHVTCLVLATVAQGDKSQKQLVPYKMIYFSESCRKFANLFIS